MATQKIMGAKEWALLLILSVLWGGSLFFIGVAVKELPPLTIMMLRVSLAAVILHVVIRLMGQWMPRDPKVWLAFAGMGLLNNVIPQTLIVWGQTQIPSGLASILNATTPLFGVLVAHFFVAGEKMRHENAKERRGCIQDGSQPAWDLRLPPDNQGLRDDIVEKPHAGKGQPHLGIA